MSDVDPKIKEAFAALIPSPSKYIVSICNAYVQAEARARMWEWCYTHDASRSAAKALVDYEQQVREELEK